MPDLALDLAGPSSGGSGVASYFGHFAGMPAAGNAGRQAFVDDSPIAQWVDDGTAWRPFINGMLGKRPPLVAAMTAFNGGTFADNNGTIKVTGVNDGAAPGQLRGLTVPNNASTAYARGTAQFLPVGDTTANHFVSFSVILRELATAKAYTLDFFQDFANRWTAYQVAVWTSNTVRPTALNKGYAVWDTYGPFAMRARRNGANLFAEFSRDGNDWTQIDTRATGTVFTTAPDQAGFAATGINAVPLFNVLSFESGSSV